MTAQPIAAARQQVAPANISSAMGESFERVFAHVARVAGILAGPPLAAYHYFGEHSIDVEIGVPVVAPIQEEPPSRDPDLPGCATPSYPAARWR